MDDIISDLERLENNAEAKRKTLIFLAYRDNKRRGFLSIVSGILSRLSALLMSSFIVKIFSSVIILGAAFAFAVFGGVIAILSSVLYKEKEIRTVYKGASDFLRLREEIGYVLSTKSQTNSEQLKNNLLQYKEDYVRISEVYGQYCDVIAKHFAYFSPIKWRRYHRFILDEMDEKQIE